MIGSGGAKPVIAGRAPPVFCPRINELFGQCRLLIKHVDIGQFDVAQGTRLGHLRHDRVLEFHTGGAPVGPQHDHQRAAASVL